ncbi:MAG: hypothetical protein ACTHJ3_02015 [Pararhizobium sp.]
MERRRPGNFGLVGETIGVVEAEIEIRLAGFIGVPILLDRLEGISRTERIIVQRLRRPLVARWRIRSGFRREQLFDGETLEGRLRALVAAGSGTAIVTQARRLRIYVRRLPILISRLRGVSGGRIVNGRGRLAFRLRSTPLDIAQELVFQPCLVAIVRREIRLGRCHGPAG